MNESADIAVLQQQQRDTDERLGRIERIQGEHGELLHKIYGGIRVFCWIASALGVLAGLAATIWATAHKQG